MSFNISSFSEKENEYCDLMDYSHLPSKNQKH